MKRRVAAAIWSFLLLFLSACTPKDIAAKPMEAGGERNKGIYETKYEKSVRETNPEQNVLKWVEADLDNDGINEKVEIIQVEIDDGRGVIVWEGWIKIHSKDEERKIVFNKGSSKITEVYQSMDIEDLDGDGARDIFIVIPDIGSSNYINYFFIYNYKADRQFCFDFDRSQEELGSFLSSFKYRYLSENKLELVSSTLKYKGAVSVGSYLGIPIPDDGMLYDNTGSPVPAAIEREDSGEKEGGRFISCVELLKTEDTLPQIKIPLLLPALHHEDIIAEIDVFFILSTDFTPIMKRFQVYSVDQTGGYKKELVGEEIID